MEWIWGIVGAVIPIVMGILKPEWLVGLWNKFSNKVIKDPVVANKIGNPLGMKMIETGFAVIKNRPDSDEEKTEYIGKIKAWIAEYEATVPDKTSTF